MKCATLYAATFTALAGKLDEDRNSIARALAEPDAPQKRKRGWVIQEIESFMFLRRLRKMTDADFDALCHYAVGEDAPPGELAEIEAIRRGGRLGMIEELENKKPMTEKDLNWLENALAETRAAL